MAYTPIDNSAEHFKAVKYTGNGSEPRNIDVGFQSDFVWVKDRTVAYHHRLFDSTRGGAPIHSNTNGAQDSNNDGPELDFSSPYSNGFKIIDNPDGTTNSYGVNVNNSEMISWNWKFNGGTTSTNTSGSVNSIVQVNSDAGMSIVKFTGNSSSDLTVGHGLGAAPHMIILKPYTVTEEWTVFHKKMGNNRFMFLNDDDGQSSEYSGYWGTPSSTTFGVKGGVYANNVNSADHIAYCFTPKQGFSRQAWFRGNGSTNGPFVYTGFKPAFVMFKQHTANGNSWFMFDSTRSPFNGVMHQLRANTTATTSSGDLMQFMSNGFKLKHNDSAFNGNNNDYIYWAFAENPFVTSSGAPTTAR